MPLKLKVISYKGRPSPDRLEVSLGQDGGTLGRSPDSRHNHLTLNDPDRYISRRHASISFENGLYYLTDTSKDGTYIQNKNIRVYRDTVVLAAGDRLRIGDYELDVSIVSDGTLETASHASIFSSEEGMPFSGIDRNTAGPMKSFPDRSNQGNNSSWSTDGDVYEKGLEADDAKGRPEESPLHESFAPPDIAGDPIKTLEIPKNFKFEELISDLDETDGTSASSESFSGRQQDTAVEQNTPAEIVEETPVKGKEDAPGAHQRKKNSGVPVPETSAGNSSPSESVIIEKMRRQVQLELFQSFLDAAGVTYKDFHQNVDMSELMPTLGVVFREMVAGLMTILRGRSELKNQLRVSATSLKPTDNNPFKFSPIVDDALKQILAKDQPGFVETPNAVREAFADIMNHQLAMTAGIQAAVIALLERFDPHHFDRQNDNGALFKRKAKSWDTFRRSYTEIVNEALENFFGEAFIHAYEEQIRKLRKKNDAS